jgi:hypothetical protein
MVGLFEHLFADGGLRHDGLNEARAVAHGQEVNLPARAPVVQPALDGDGLPLVLGDVFDIHV